MRLYLAGSLLLVCVGCLTPRSVGLGNTAAALGPGNHEVAVSAGFSWQTETAAPVLTETNVANVATYTTTSGVQIPAAEANVQFGLTRTFGLNLHVSPAGIQPGLKVTLLKKAVVLGVLPELGFGWANGASQQIQFVNQNRTDADPAFANRIILNAGARVLIFHPGSGAYGGVGYQLQSFIQRSSQDNGGTTSRTSQTDTLHNVLAAVGYEFKTGSLRIRPEIAFSVTPERSTSNSVDDAAATSRSGGNAFFLFPNVTFAIVGQAAAARDDETGDEEESRERRREEGDEAEGDEDELDENARVKKKQKRAPAEDDTERVRRKTSPIREYERRKPAEEESETDSDSTTE